MQDDIEDEIADAAVRDDADRPAVPALRGRVRVLREDAAKWWWLPMVTGNIWILIAGLVLRVPPTSSTAVAALLGGAFVVAAFTEAVQVRLMAGAWRAVQAGLAVVFALGAVAAFARPTDTLHTLTSVLGFLLLAQGAFYVVRALALRKSTPYWSIGLVSGTLVAQLAPWVFAADHAWDGTARTTFLLLWLGLGAAFRGISDMTLALGLHRTAPQPARRAAAAAEG